MNQRLDTIRRAYITLEAITRTIEGITHDIPEDEEETTEETNAEEVPILTVEKRSITAPAFGRRTPEQQANYVIGGSSWTCGGAHIADNARHVYLLLDGNYSDHPERDLINNFNRAVRDVFIDAWGEAMAENNLVNFRAQPGWGRGDAYHLELPGGRPASNSTEVEACFREYVRRTRGEGANQNDRFEERFSDRIERINRELFGDDEE